jgi:hypothetical protein
MQPAFGPHLDPAFIDPTHYVILICHRVVVARILAAKSALSDACGKVIAALEKFESRSVIDGQVYR